VTRRSRGARPVYRGWPSTGGLWILPVDKSGRCGRSRGLGCAGVTITLLTCACWR
jgi:hypothetical protein